VLRRGSAQGSTFQGIKLNVKCDIFSENDVYMDRFWQRYRAALSYGIQLQDGVVLVQSHLPCIL